MTAPSPDLVLRAPRPGDAAGLAALMSLPGVRRGTLRLPYETEEGIARRFLAESASRHTVIAAVGDEVVGYGALLRDTGRRAHCAELVIAVHDAHTGRGIGGRLLAALVDLADNWLGLVRIELSVDTDNTAALALYDRAGFVHEGTERASVLRDGALVDSHRMARLRPPPGSAHL